MNYKYIYKYDEELELYDKLVKAHLLFNNINLQDQQINILIYFCKYGISQDTYQKIIKGKVVTTNQIISNTKTILKKHGLIIKEKYNSWKVNPKLNMELEDTLSINVLCRFVSND